MRRNKSSRAFPSTLCGNKERGLGRVQKLSDGLYICRVIRESHSERSLLKMKQTVLSYCHVEVRRDIPTEQQGRRDSSADLRMTILYPSYNGLLSQRQIVGQPTPFFY